jgi:hypothetical protein
MRMMGAVKALGNLPDSCRRGMPMGDAYKPASRRSEGFSLSWPGPLIGKDPAL